jgi:putative DNA primase/helicase
MRSNEGAAGDFGQVPAELRARNQWVCWRRDRRNSRDTKVPVSPTNGHVVSINDPASLSSFEVARRALGQLRVDGIGFVFTDADPFCGIDLDNALDAVGQPKAWAHELLDLLPVGAYVEVSPSGQGLHVILIGTKPDSKFRTPIADGCLEVYDRIATSRFRGVATAHLARSWFMVRRRSTRFAHASWVPPAA